MHRVYNKVSNIFSTRISPHNLCSGLCVKSDDSALICLNFADECARCGEPSNSTQVTIAVPLHGSAYSHMPAILRDLATELERIQQEDRERRDKNIESIFQ